MRKTSDLIDALADGAEPVKRLRPPAARTAVWLGFAALVLCLLSISHGLRADIYAKLHTPLFIVSMGGALATAVLAALAAFKISLPDGSRWWALLPAPALAVWLSGIGYGCLTDWVAMSPDGVRPGEAVRCFATLLLTSVPLSILLLIMLRHAALLRPGLVCTVAGLAIAAMTAFALSLFHDLDATIMILMWNVGVAAIIAGLSSVLGRPALEWTSQHFKPALPAQLPRRR